MMRNLLSLAGIAFLLLISAVLAATEEGSPASRSSLNSNHDAIWLRQAPWTEDERSLYYHLTSGTQLVPYSWFLALEQTDTSDPFTADTNITQLLLIPDKAHSAHNRDRLPIGLTKTVYPDDPRGTKEYLGITCAFCHTGELQVSTKDHGRLSIYIDGGVSMQDNAQFLEALGASFRRTATEDKKFSAFAAAVLPQPHDEARRAFLRKKVAEAGDKMAARARLVKHWGFGRFDALNRGSNWVFMPLNEQKNAKELNAPVSIPPLWNVHLYDWVQWNGSFQNPLARNVAQVIGIGAGLFQNADSNKPELSERPLDPFVSSLDIDKLRQLENMVTMIKPPRWPDEVFGRINEKLAREGKQLYRDNCKHCHVPDPSNPVTFFGQRFSMTMIPAAEVGTDPEYLKFAARTIYTGVLEQDFGSASLPANEAIERLTTRLMKRSTQDTGPNQLRVRAELMARPHAGVWATPPFLHNGSVPTLYEVLSPVEERTPCFYLGDLEYDPVNVGYTVRPCSNGELAKLFKFDTTLPGNSHAGHEFRKDDHAGHVFTKSECETLKNMPKERKNGILGCELSRAERLALIEYLKTCDLDTVTWDVHPTPKICEARRVFLSE
jgi:hypothetical protein